MRNKNVFRLGLIVLFLMLVAIAYGYYITKGTSNTTNTTNMTNSTSNVTNPVPTTPQTQSQRGESSVVNDTEHNVRADCPICTSGTVASHKQCGRCGSNKRIYDPATHSYIDCPDCTEDDYWMPCPNCGGDGYLDPGDPGYAG
jgi:hypothetical protein